MPWYNDLRPVTDNHKIKYGLIFPDMTDAEKKRTLTNLLRLRSGLDQKIARKESDRNLLVASWNIKEFGHTSQRLPEAYFYIAEILNRFDLVAVQEVKSSLYDIDIIMRLLGKEWGYMINDITEGTDGNSERSAYLYNRKRVGLSGIAGELTLWDELTKDSPVKQLKRTPYITGFRASWKAFSLVNLHLHPGEDDDDIQYRKREVELLLKAMEKKIASGHYWNRNIIAIGDMNLYDGEDRDDPTIKLINDAGFVEVHSLVGKKTNASQTESYDRIFFSGDDYFMKGDNPLPGFRGDVFNPYDYVYRMEDSPHYLEFMKEHYGGSKDLDMADERDWYYEVHWRKNQLSDHLPIWVEMIIDSSDAFLRNKLETFD